MTFGSRARKGVVNFYPENLILLQVI